MWFFLKNSLIKNLRPVENIISRKYVISHFSFSEKLFILYLWCETKSSETLIDWDCYETWKYLSKTFILYYYPIILWLINRVTSFPILVICSGKCARFKAIKPAQIDLSRYEADQKYCTQCAIFMYVDELRCPCCTRQLKIRSKNKKIREVMFNRIWITDQELPYGRRLGIKKTYLLWFSFSEKINHLDAFSSNLIQNLF